MDEIASDHAVMHGLLSFQHNRRNLNLSHKRIHRNVNRGTRSISLLDRRGLINAPRFPTRKSSISPLPHHRRHDVDSADTLAMLMHLMKKDDADDPFCAMFLPTTYKSTHHHSSSMIWQHLQHTVPLRVQSFSRNNVGKVLLTLQYHADESKLSVDIVQIKDIIGRQNCDIFLSVQLLQSCKILEKYETCSKRLASKIYFKQTMEFNVPIALYHSNDTNLLIKVCQDIRKTTEIGHFIIGPQGNSVGAQHWKRIFSIPNISFSAWHTLTATINFPNKFLKM
ncbi:Synaptotagmin-12 [Dirofilaria immitis]